jgi:transporter family protein
VGKRLDWALDYRILCLAALVLWGVWGWLSKIATRIDPASSFAFWTTVASLLPIAAFAFTAAPKHGLKLSPLMLAAGLCAGAATVAFYLALHKGPASVVMPFTGMYILIPAVLGIIVLKEPMTVMKGLGLASAVLAVFFLSR